jgi:misacylated tRNA(Ala) deacylase
MTEELFRADGYLRECAATVQAVDPNGIDWERRHRLMRFHTTTHLLCHLVPQLVIGCSITPDYARLDFNMTDPLDKDELSAGIARLVAAAHPNTPEIGSVAVTRIEKKSATTRRVVLGFA